MATNQSLLTRVHKDISEFDVEFTINKVGSHSSELFFEQRVAETESGAWEFGKDGRIASRIIAYRKPRES